MSKKYTVKSCLMAGTKTYKAGDTIEPAEKDLEELFEKDLIEEFDPEAKDKAIEKAAAGPGTPPKPDDLTDISGIGDDIAATLNRIGVGDFKTLSNMPVDRLAELPGVSPKKAKGFIKEAKKLANKK